MKQMMIIISLFCSVANLFGQPAAPDKTTPVTSEDGRYVSVELADNPYTVCVYDTVTGEPSLYVESPAMELIRLTTEGVDDNDFPGGELAQDLEVVVATEAPPAAPNVTVTRLNTAASSASLKPGATIDMGTITVGDAPASQSFIMYNSGTAPLTFSRNPAISVSGDNAAEFAVVAGETAGALAPGETMIFDIRFMPLAGGAREATITLSTNDPDQPVISYSVVGLANQPPTADAGFDITARKLDEVTLSAVGSSDPDGESVSLSYEWVYRSGPVEDAPVLSPDATSQTVTFTPVEEGTYVFEIAVSDGLVTSTDEVSVVVTSRTRLVTGSIRAHSDEWKEVNLPFSYESMVVVCTMQYSYDPNRPPLSARISDAMGASFKLRLFPAARTTSPIRNVKVHYMVVEEGSYSETVDGIKMEARTYTSSTLSRKGSMRPGTYHDYSNAYRDPVVVGQIMSTNDSGYQVFWAHGRSTRSAPTGTDLRTGRHIGEDPRTTRLSETVGYIVWETGLNRCDGTTIVAGRTEPTVTGMADGKHTQPIPSITPTAAVLSSAGMTYDEGGVPVLNGDDAVGRNHLDVSIEEDTLRDSDRHHNSEGVAYVAFDTSSSALPVAEDVTVSTRADTPVNLQLAGSNLSGNEVWNVIAAPTNGTLSGTPPDVTYTPDVGFEGSDSFTFNVTDGGAISGTAKGVITVKPVNPFLLTGVVSAGTDSWTTVRLPRSFVSMVPVCTPEYDPADCPPLAVRVQNAYGNSFQIKLARADDSTESVGDIPVHYMVIEEGQYTAEHHGMTVEARRYKSREISETQNGVLTQQSYLNRYKAPVVVGQVLSTNNPGFQVFWASGATSSSPPSAEALSTGRHVGEDPISHRPPEDIGYIVFEAGAGSLAGLSLEAGLTPDAVTHNAFSQPVSSLTPGVAIVSAAGIDGSSGYIPLLSRASMSPGGFKMLVDEDQLSDDDRSHATEHLAYVAVTASPRTMAYVPDQVFICKTSGDDRVSEPMPITLKGLSVEPTDSWIVVTSPDNGTLEGDAPCLTYRPRPGFKGTDTFTVQVRGDMLNSNIGTVSIELRSATENQQPVVEAVSAGTDPDNVTNPAILEVIAWDPEDDPLTYSWECVDGPGQVNFMEFAAGDSSGYALPAQRECAQVSFSQPGNYTLKVTASDRLNKPQTSYLAVSVKGGPSQPLTASPISATGCRIGRSHSVWYLIPLLLAVVGIVLHSRWRKTSV